jgi:hypothetical protein
MMAGQRYCSSLPCKKQVRESGALPIPSHVVLPNPLVSLLSPTRSAAIHPWSSSQRRDAGRKPRTPLEEAKAAARNIPSRHHDERKRSPTGVAVASTNGEAPYTRGGIPIRPRWDGRLQARVGGQTRGRRLQWPVSAGTTDLSDRRPHPLLPPPEGWR